MDLVTSYQILGVSPGVPFADVKAAYRRLARRYHPDVNPDNVEWASQQFIEVTEAYQLILQMGSSPLTLKTARTPYPTYPSPSQAVPPPAVSPQVAPFSTQPGSTPASSSRRYRKRPVVRANPQLSAIDNRLKQQSYEQLQHFLKHQRFPRAIALVEGLAQRIQNDPEVHQWQAITYQQWARHLTTQKEFRKAQIYLKKALKADPYNRRLWTEVKAEFRRIEQVVSQYR